APASAPLSRCCRQRIRFGSTHRPAAPRRSMDTSEDESDLRGAASQVPSPVSPGSSRRITSSPWPALMGRVFTPAILGAHNADNHMSLATLTARRLLPASVAWHAVTEPVTCVYYASRHERRRNLRQHRQVQRSFSLANGVGMDRRRRGGRTVPAVVVERYPKRQHQVPSR